MFIIDINVSFVAPRDLSVDGLAYTRLPGEIACEPMQVVSVKPKYVGCNSYKNFHLHFRLRA